MDLLDAIRKNKVNRKLEVSLSSDDTDIDYSSSFLDDVPMAREFLTKRKQKNKPQDPPPKTKQSTRMEVKRRSVLQRAFESAADKFPVGCSTPRPGSIISIVAPKLSPILVDIDENINKEINYLNERPKSKLNKSHQVQLNINKDGNDNLGNIAEVENILGTINSRTRQQKSKENRVSKRDDTVSEKSKSIQSKPVSQKSQNADSNKSKELPEKSKIPEIDRSKIIESNKSIKNFNIVIESGNKTQLQKSRKEETVSGDNNQSKVKQQKSRLHETRNSRLNETKELIHCVKLYNVNEVESNEPYVPENAHLDDPMQELNELPKSRKSTNVEPDKTNCEARVLKVNVLRLDVSNKLQENESDMKNKSRKTKLGQENINYDATKSDTGNRLQLQKSRKGESFLETDNQQKSSSKAKSNLNDVKESDYNVKSDNMEVELDEPDAPERKDTTEFNELHKSRKSKIVEPESRKDEGHFEVINNKLEQQNQKENSWNVEINQMENTREERLELGAPRSKRCINKLQDITLMKGVSLNTSPGRGKLRNTRKSKASDEVEGNSVGNVAKNVLNKRKTVSTNTSLPIKSSRHRIKEKPGSRHSRVKTQDFGTSPMVRDEDANINDVFEEIVNDKPAIRPTRLNTRDFGTSPLMTNEVTEENAKKIMDKPLSKHKRTTTQDFGTSPIVRDEDESIIDVFEEKMDTRASSHKRINTSTKDVIIDENISKMNDKSVSKHKCATTHDFGTSPMVNNEDRKVNDENIKNKCINTQDFGTSPLIRDDNDIIENKLGNLEDKSVSNRKRSTTHDFVSPVSGCDDDDDTNSKVFEKASVKLKVKNLQMIDNKSLSKFKPTKTQEFGTSPIVRNDDIKDKSKSSHKQVNTQDFGTSPMVRNDAVNSNNDVFEEDLIKDKPVSKPKHANTQVIRTSQMVPDEAISENVKEFSVDDNPGNVYNKTPIHRFKSPMKETITTKSKKKAKTVAQSSTDGEMEGNLNSIKNTENSSSKKKRNNSKNSVQVVGSISSSNTTRNHSAVHKRIGEKFKRQKNIGEAKIWNYLDAGSSLAAGTISRYNRVRRPTRVIQFIYEESEEPKSKRNKKQPRNLDKSSPIKKKIGKKRGLKSKTKNSTIENIDQLVNDQQIPIGDEILQVKSGESSIRGKKTNTKITRKEQHNNEDNVESMEFAHEPVNYEQTAIGDDLNVISEQPSKMDKTNYTKTRGTTKHKNTQNNLDGVSTSQIIQPVCDKPSQLGKNNNRKRGKNYTKIIQENVMSPAIVSTFEKSTENDGEEPKRKILKNNSEQTKNHHVVTSNINDCNEMELSENQKIDKIEEQQNVNGNGDPDFESNGRHKELVHSNKLEFHYGNEMHSIPWASPTEDLQWSEIFPSVMITSTMDSSSQTIGIMEIDAGASVPWCRNYIHEVSYLVCKSTAEVILPGRDFIMKPVQRFIIPKGMPFTIINQSQTEKLLLEFTKYEDTRMV